MFNWDKNIPPPRYESWFTPVTDIHNYNTRNMSNLYKNYSKYVTVLNSVSYNGP